MTEPRRILRLLQQDPRFKLEAYQFIRDALTFAQEELGMGQPVEICEEGDEVLAEPHLTGQQLCEAIRQYAIEQYGYMSKLVLNSWGLRTTSDFGDVVYNLIEIELMKKSDSDRREDFDDVYDFDVAFLREFRISLPE